MKVIFSTLAFIILGSQMIFAQSNVGFIYMDSVLTSYPGYNTAVYQYDSLRSVLNTELTNEQKKINQNNDAFLKKYSLRGGENIEEIMQLIAPSDTLAFSQLLEDNNVLNVRQKSYENLIRYLYNKDIDPIVQSVKNEIDIYAKKHKIDIVFIMENIEGTYVYLNSACDLTDEIIKRVQK